MRLGLKNAFGVGQESCVGMGTSRRSRFQFRGKQRHIYILRAESSFFCSSCYVYLNGYSAEVEPMFGTDVARLTRYKIL